MDYGLLWRSSDEMIAGTGPELLQPCIFYYSLKYCQCHLSSSTLPYLTLPYLTLFTLPYSKVLRSIPYYHPNS